MGNAGDINTTAELEYYGGDGYCGVPETGEFQVVYDLGARQKEVSFKSLLRAREFYDNLVCSKGLWNLKGLELLECHTIKDPTEKEDDGELPF